MKGLVWLKKMLFHERACLTLSHRWRALNLAPIVTKLWKSATLHDLAHPPYFQRQNKGHCLVHVLDMKGMYMHHSIKEKGS